MATEIHPTAIVSPSAEIGQDVIIGPYSIIGDETSLGDGTVLDSHVVINNFTTLGPKCKVASFAAIGGAPQDLKYAGEKTYCKIGGGTIIREYVTVNRGTPTGGGVTEIGENCMLMATSHVAHDCKMGNNVIIANAVLLAGHVHLGNYSNIGGATVVHQFVRIGDYAYVGGASAVVQDVPPYVLASNRTGEGFLHGLNKIGLKRRGFSDAAMAALKKAYRIYFRFGLTIPEATERIKAEVDLLPEVVHLIDFMQSTKRGIAR